jgi:hypothetical protein
MFTLYTTGSIILGIIIGYSAPEKSIRRITKVTGIVVLIYLTIVEIINITTQYDERVWMHFIIIAGILATTGNIILTTNIIHKMNKQRKRKQDEV